jgi:deoxyribonuclease-1
LRYLFLFLTSLLSFSVSAEQTVIRDYNDARNNYFYDQIYIGNTGESLYCGINRPIFDNIGKHKSLEHVMPADWMAEHFGCPNRNECDNTTYKHAEGDLHNLWIAVKNINSSRSDHLFGETDVGEARFDYCPLFVRTYSPNPIVVEPRDSVKGNIARSLFYMKDEYGFDLKGMLPMLKRWNRLDPPAEHEHWRNERIFELQGTRNKFIDNYHLGNALQ